MIFLIFLFSLFYSFNLSCVMNNEPLMRSRHVRRTTSSLNSDRDTAHNWELKERQCAPCARPRNCAKDHAPQERRGTLNKRQLGTKNRHILHFCVILKNIPPVYTFLQTTLTETKRLFTCNPSTLRSSKLSVKHVCGTFLSCRIDYRMSNNSDLMSYSRISFFIYFIF